jgi:hypothetical protein
MHTTTIATNTSAVRPTIHHSKAVESSACAFACVAAIPQATNPNTTSS